MFKKKVANNLNSVAPEGTDQARDRKEDLYDALVPTSGTVYDTTDRWGSGKKKVSIEREAEKTWRIQDGLDNLVEDENKFPEDPEAVTRRGQPPCKRVRKEG
jgi:hypothetical protein